MMFISLFLLLSLILLPLLLSLTSFLLSFNPLLLSCLLFQFVYLCLDLFFDLIDDLIVVKLLPLLELWFSNAIWMVILTYSVLPLLLPYFYLFYNSDQVVAQPFENSFKLKFFEFDDYFMKLAGILNVLVHLGGQHLKVVKYIIANDCSKGDRR